MITLRLGPEETDVMWRVLLATDIRCTATVLIAEHWLWNPLEKIQFVWTQPYPVYCDEHPVPLTMQFTSLISLCSALGYFNICQIWNSLGKPRHLSINIQQCVGDFTEKEKIGSTKTSFSKKFMIYHGKKLTDCENMCMLYW